MSVKNLSRLTPCFTQTERVILLPEYWAWYPWVSLATRTPTRSQTLATWSPFNWMNSSFFFFSITISKTLRSNFWWFLTLSGPSPFCHVSFRKTTDVLVLHSHGLLSAQWRTIFDKRNAYYLLKGKFICHLNFFSWKYQLYFIYIMHEKCFLWTLFPQKYILLYCILDVKERFGLLWIQCMYNLIT